MRRTLMILTLALAGTACGEPELSEECKSWQDSTTKLVVLAASGESGDPAGMLFEMLKGQPEDCPIPDNLPV